MSQNNSKASSLVLGGNWSLCSWMRALTSSRNSSETPFSGGTMLNSLSIWSMFPGNSNQKSLVAKISGWKYKTSGLPKGPSVFLLRLILCSFHCWTVLSSSLLMKDIKQNLMHSRWMLSEVSKIPWSALSLKTSIQYCPHMLLRFLQNLSMRVFLVDDPYIKLDTPWNGSLWYQRSAYWMSLTIAFSVPLSP